MKISSILILAIGFMIISSFTTVTDQTLRADKTKSFLSYSANHTLHAWTGTSKKVDCLLIYNEETKTFKKVAVSSNVADFDSKNSSRDGHALEVLDAIDAYYDEDYDRLITLPAPITWRDQNTAPASAIVEAHHLDAWLPQYD